MFKIHLISEKEGLDETVECDGDTYILDVGEDLGLPYSCRAGACSSCAGKLIRGEVNQDEQTFLEDDQLENGFILTCVAMPKSDCEIECHAEDDLF